MRRSIFPMIYFLIASMAFGMHCSFLPASPANIQADYHFQIPEGSRSARFDLEASSASEGSILVEGLSLGGAVEVRVNAQPVEHAELLSLGGLKGGKADAVLFAAVLKEGNNIVEVSEKPGAQIVHVPGTRQWFATTSDAAGRPLFSVDFDRLKKLSVGYPITVYFGPKYQPFCWVSGKFDEYHKECYAKKVHGVLGNSGSEEATLSYITENPERNLVMPIRLTLVRKPGKSFAIRFHQGIQATAEPTWGGNLEFLHLVIDGKYGHDWGDGVPDFVWYRTQREDAPDTLPGSHTTLVRMDDNTLRQYPYPASTSDPKKIALSGPHHVRAAVSMEAENTIGGWFTKSGVGSIGLVFHRYEASFRDDLAPLHSHCGDGADTHVYLFWNDLFRPLGMKAGDRVDIEYSLTMLPTEPLHTDIEDINEADLFFFGKENEQRSRITGWIGTKEALGLTRDDGSVVLLGIGTKAGRVAIPEASQAKAQRVFRMFDLGRHRNCRALEIVDGKVEVRPRWITVVDCGSARHGPQK